MLSRASSSAEPFDIVVIGGGATGLGVAVDGATRGHSVALFERDDFGAATSSRSTKLVHGGVRYLRSGEIGLVRSALRERERLRRNAPHLVGELDFVVPSLRWYDSLYYGAGLKVYDLLARGGSFPASGHLSRRGVERAVPGISRAGLRGGTRYTDGQFDDARLIVNLAQTAADHGAAVANYAPVVGLEKDDTGRVQGVGVRDEETGEAFTVRARCVVNATGPFADDVRRMDHAGAEAMIAPSQGAHVVLDRSFLGGDAALMIPRTPDGRVLFATPWEGVVIVGTTDTALEAPARDPAPMEQEIDFLLETAGRVLERSPTRSDVRSVFAGVRPLVRAGGNGRNTASLSRDHTVRVDDRSGLVTIAGGKWTTYRAMAEDAVDEAARVGGLEPKACATADLAIRGADPNASAHGDLARYGADASRVAALASAEPAMDARVHDSIGLTRAEVAWACREEMARTVEDVLARRSRWLIRDARGALAAARGVGEIMARELGRDASWMEKQIARFEAVARGCILTE